MRSFFSQLFAGRNRVAAPTRRPRPDFFFRPSVEGLEDREVLSATMAHVPALAAPLIAHVAQHQHVFNVVPLSITGITNQAGQLMAQGTLGSQTFTAPVTLEAATATTTATKAAAAAAATTPILHLTLGPIHLNVLGLTVDTSPICLNIDAQSGPGNLLGNLLTDVANLLNNGTSLGDILGGLSATDLTSLTNGLTGLLNGALGQVTSSAAVTRAATPATGNILHLALGPVDLNLLGLLVHLDNCSNGPVTVDIGAQTGPGNLLGNLLNDLTHLLDQPANRLARVVSVITHLI